MAYTMEQRLRKQQLLRADREIFALTISREKIELEERQIIPWIFERLFAYKEALAEAQQAGKLGRAERDFLIDADGTPRLFAYWADFWACLCETQPEIRRLGLFDSMTEGKGLRLCEETPKTGCFKGRSTAAGDIPN